MDRIKALFSGGSPAGAAHDHSGHDHSHEEPVKAPTPEEMAAAARAEPPTTTVEGLSEDEPRDEVH
jgi:hypothetical protein